MARARVIAVCLAAAVSCCFMLMFTFDRAEADGMPGGEEGKVAPEPLPRRDIEYGNTKGNVFMGRDEQGNEVTEIKPRQRKQPSQQEQPAIGPILVVPEVRRR